MSKTVSFGVMHISVAFLVIWAMTGSWQLGGAVALVEPLVNTVAYLFPREGMADGDKSCRR